MGSWVGRLHSCALAGARAEMAGTITVKKMGGVKVDVPIGPATTVADVKAELVLELGVALAQQKLLFKGKPLADDKPLREYRIGDGSALNLMTLKPKKDIEAECAFGVDAEVLTRTHGIITQGEQQAERLFRG